MTNFNIVIPTCERANTLEWSLKTCLNQNYKNYKIWVIDNFSSDNTYDVVKKYNDSRINYFKTEERLSMQDNWEFALNCVLDSEPEGYISYLGDDDGMYPNSLENVAKIIRDTNAPAIKPFTPYYNWKNSLYEAERGILRIYNSNNYYYINSIDILDFLSNNLIYFYGCLITPDIYKGFISLDLIRKIKKRDGNFFNCDLVPDLYSSIIIAGELDNYIFSQEPIFINGCSKKSNGASLFANETKQNKSSKKIADEFLNLNKKKTYNLTGMPITIGDAFLISECLLEANLRNKRIPTPKNEDILKSLFIQSLNYPITEKKMLEIVESFANKKNLNQYKQELFKQKKSLKSKHLIHPKFINHDVIEKKFNTNNEADNIYDVSLFLEKKFKLKTNFIKTDIIFDDNNFHKLKKKIIQGIKTDYYIDFSGFELGKNIERKKLFFSYNFQTDKYLTNNFSGYLIVLLTDKINNIEAKKVNYLNNLVDQIWVKDNNARLKLIDFGIQDKLIKIILDKNITSISIKIESFVDELNQENPKRFYIENKVNFLVNKLELEENSDKSIKIYSEILEINLKQIPSYLKHQISNLLFSKKEYKKAIKYLNSCISEKYINFKVFELMAKSLKEIGEIELANSFYNKAKNISN